MEQDVKEFIYSVDDYSFSISNLGCAVTSIIVPDKNGKYENIVLSVPNLIKNPENVKNGAYFGLTIGRYANRISNSSFSVDKKKFFLKPNENNNLLHSGDNGLAYRLFSVKKAPNGFDCSINLAEKDDGFPGDFNLNVKFSFLISNFNKLKICLFRINYNYTCTEKCPVNITNHSYFNLTGNYSKDITSHIVQMNSSKVFTTDEENLPKKLIDVKKTKFDFLNGKEIGHIPYDNTYIVNKKGLLNKGFTRCCSVFEPESGRLMAVYSDMPAFHFYNSPELSNIGLYNNYSGFCIETGYIPNSINNKFIQKINGNTIIEPNKLYSSSTYFVFYI